MNFGGYGASGKSSNDSYVFHSYFASNAVPRFLFIWIMKVLTASLLPSLSGGDISVSITASFNGEDVCRVKLPGGTLADLERVLCDPHGPMFGSYPWSRLLFYTEDEPLSPLDLNLQMDSFHSLVIKRGDVEVFLEKFPHVGKFLEAMASNKFDPKSPKFDISWTAEKRPVVVNAEQLVQDFLSGLPAHADSGLHFVQIFGKLTAMGECWNMLNLELLQVFDPGLKRFKHSVSQHWLELARVAATSTISEATPIILPATLLLKINQLGKVFDGSLIGDGFPSNFDGSLINSLMNNEKHPNVKWRDVAQTLLSLDWSPEEGLGSLHDLLNKIEQEPCEFASLKHQEVSHMVHLQLRLSCCRVAEVEGPINEACVKMLAELLAYKLKILKFESVAHLKTQMSDFEGDANHRGTLVLVTDLPASTGRIFAWPGWPHRMVLCYNAEGQNAAALERAKAD
eukprot:s278_g50.t1